LTDET